MKKITSTQKKAVIMIILNLMIFSLCFFVFKDIKAKSNAISEIKNELDQQTQKETQYLSIKDTIQKTEKDRKIIDSFFVPAGGEVDFIELLEKEGKASEVIPKIISVQVEDKTPDSSVETLLLEVEAVGSWHGVYYFLSLIENLPYAVHIEKVTMRKEEEAWRAQFSLRVLKLKK